MMTEYMPCWRVISMHVTHGGKITVSPGQGQIGTAVAALLATPPQEGGEAR